MSPHRPSTSTILLVLILTGMTLNAAVADPPALTPGRITLTDGGASTDAATITTLTGATADLTGHAAAALGYFPTLTVNTSATIREIGGVYNVKAFGAVCDGSSRPLSTIYGSLAAAQAVYPHATALTNQLDWAAIQGAINAAFSAGGGSVFVPPGVCLNDGTLVLKYKVNLLGGSLGAYAKNTFGTRERSTIKLAANSNVPMLINDRVNGPYQNPLDPGVGRFQDSVIDGINFDALPGNNQDPTAYAIDIDLAWSMTIRNTMVEAALAPGIHVNHSNILYFIDVSVRGNTDTQNAIFLDHVEDSLFQGLHLGSVQGDVVVLNKTSRTVWQSNFIFHSLTASGMHLTNNTVENVFDGNRFDQNYEDGMVVDAGSNQNTITSNVFVENGFPGNTFGIGLNMSGSKNVVVGNQFSTGVGNAGLNNQSYGFAINANADYNSFLGNYADGAIAPYFISSTGTSHNAVDNLGVFAQDFSPIYNNTLNIGNSTAVVKRIAIEQVNGYPDLILNGHFDNASHEIVIQRLTNPTASVTTRPSNNLTFRSAYWDGSNVQVLNMRERLNPQGTGGDYRLEWLGNDGTRLLGLSPAGLDLPVGHIGVGVSDPIAYVDIAGPDTDRVQFQTTVYGDAAQLPGFFGRMAAGTSASPSAVGSGDPLVALAGFGYHSGGAFGSSARGQVRVAAAESWTSTTQGADIRFFTTPVGGTATAEKVRITDTGNLNLLTGALQTGGTTRISSTGVVTAATGSTMSGVPIARIVSVPSTASSACTVGDIAQDGSYAYFCTATNTWLRAAIATW